MEVAEQYFFKDFTIQSYYDMLEEALKYYKFIDYFSIEEAQSPSIVNRHDVDFSVHRSLALAKIEHGLGIKSTYFFNPHCEFYNLLERRVADLVLEIQSLGHTIGLHFDSHFWKVERQSELDKYLRIDKNVMEVVYGSSINVFSFHNTTEFTMSCREEQYAGILNVYSKKIFDLFTYCSDSNGYWRYQRMPELIASKKHKFLQILTHPEWWVDEIQSPWDKIQRAIRGRCESNLQFYKEHLSNFKMKNIDWHGEI